jgi:hypothetical protein
LDKDVGHHAVLTRDGSEARKFTVDPNEGCIQIPFAARARPLAAHLAGESGAELAAPTADALMRHDDGEDRGMSLSDRSHSSRPGQEARHYDGDHLRPDDRVHAPTRRLRPRDADGGWESPLCNRPADLGLGLVGLGSIGARVAKIGHAFGIKMIAWNENLTTERAAEHGIGRVDKAELFNRSDVVSVQRRLSDQTERISRGGLVNEVELIDVLRERRIVGAGLDVFEVEPLPHDSLLRSHFRVFFRTGVVVRTQKRR